ncbi:MAG: MFS transporter [Devosia sp.]|nr:MFS transporter [Devosia sp.]
MSSRDEAIGSSGGHEVQSDYDKLRRLPYLYTFNVLNTAALLCTVSTPLALYAAELGVPKDRIGLLGGIMPFAQVLCIAFLPLVMQFSQRITSALAYGGRYLFLLPWLAAPLFLGTPDIVFWILFGSMTLFSISRTVAETALWPWSQEYTPKQVRGRISGITSLLVLPAALLGSLAIQLWLDSRTGIDRFFPVIVIGVMLGLVSAFTLLGLGGGKPRPGSARGLDAIKAMRTPIRDGNFWLYLYSSGTQFFVYTVVNLFLVLYFRERLGISSGQLVLMAAFIPVGGAAGALISGWFVDRYGTRAIRITLQGLQVVLLFCLLLVNDRLPGVHVIAGAIFFLFGLLFQSSISVGGIYMLNYVPPAQKENYMTLAYATDGIIGGGVTFLAGMLLNFLEVQPVTLFGTTLGSYETLFVVSAVAVVSSAIAFGLLKEEGATGVRDFFGQFRRGSPIRALLSIHRYGALTSEERRRELTYGFGGTRSALVKEELIAALSDPSFDVRHEAIQSLGHLPPSPAVIRALESMLTYEGLVELQYAALASLGRIKSRDSGHRVAHFLDSPNPLLRARAMRTLGDIRDDTWLPRIRTLLLDDPEIDCRLAAVSALGKFRDHRSIDGLLGIYRQLAGDDAGLSGEPRSKVVLLALAKILDLEESFSREWRREEKVVGYRLPNLLDRLRNALRRRSTEESEQHSRLLTKAAVALSTGSTGEAFAALQSLRSYVAASGHAAAPSVLQIMDGTRDIAQPHRALLILLSLALRPVLSA